MIHILTDSTSDIGLTRAAQLGVEILPLTVLFGEESFRDGVDITSEEFFDRLSKADTLPTTAQIPPETFVDAFQRLTADGGQVLGLFISSEMSGTYQSAMIARGIVGEENIAIVDTHTVTFGLGLLVETACRLRDQGFSLAELAAEMEALAPRCRLLAVVDTLRYLKMGGRISGVTAMVGGILGITPIISIENGLVVSVGKSRGRKAGFQFIRKWLEEKEAIDTSLPVAFGHTNMPSAMEECMAFFQKETAGAQLCPSSIGAVVGTHVGPGAAGLAYFVKA
ncbi:DegV family protein [Pseudoflavonifractor phocaeensis]|uniref:DegV family protein n=1 Tax=Pseudoflavonifractor phocaeensis TaxID=1870988 RepID=UPI00195E7E89|nr:DegV family protein [Pseudoflavonifractor phocaeensis]MBM6870151.1 DegV family protein [Pseudoflavonifractor phocaeensis]